MNRRFPKDKRKGRGRETQAGWANPWYYQSDPDPPRSTQPEANPNAAESQTGWSNPWYYQSEPAPRGSNQAGATANAAEASTSPNRPSNESKPSETPLVGVPSTSTHPAPAAEPTSSPVGPATPPPPSPEATPSTSMGSRTRPPYPPSESSGDSQKTTARPSASYSPHLFYDGNNINRSDAQQHPAAVVRLPPHVPAANPTHETASAYPFRANDGRVPHQAVPHTDSQETMAKIEEGKKVNKGKAKEEVKEMTPAKVEKGQQQRQQPQSRDKDAKRRDY